MKRRRIRVAIAWPRLVRPAEGGLVGVISFLAIDGASAAWRADVLRSGNGAPALAALAAVAIAGVEFGRIRV